MPDISREYLEREIASLESELRKAEVFRIQAQAVLDAYRMLLAKSKEPDENQPVFNEP
jgi:hypothetical protein